MCRPEFYILDEGFCLLLEACCKLLEGPLLSPQSSRKAFTFIENRCFLPPDDVTSIARDSFRNGAIEELQNEYMYIEEIHQKSGGIPLTAALIKHLCSSHRLQIASCHVTLSDSKVQQTCLKSSS